MRESWWFYPLYDSRTAIPYIRVMEFAFPTSIGDSLAGYFLNGERLITLESTHRSLSILLFVIAVGRHAIV